MTKLVLFPEMIISENFPYILSGLEQSINTRREYTNFRTYSVCKIANQKPDSQHSSYMPYEAISQSSRDFHDDQEAPAESR